MTPPLKLDGRIAAERVYQSIRERMGRLNIMPGLGIICVGEDPASILYVGLKQKAAQKLGILFTNTNLPTHAPENEVLAAIEAFNQRTDIHGVVVQLPLPPQLDTPSILAAVRLEKDVDGLSPAFQSCVRSGEQMSWLPALDKSILGLLAEAGETYSGRSFLIIAKSPEFRSTLSAILQQRGAAVEEASSLSDASIHIRHADVVISAIGIPHAIHEYDLKPESTIIDCGISRTDDGMLSGDFELSNTPSRIRAYSPVPGGIGPLTVASLLDNTLLAAENTISGSK